MSALCRRRALGTIIRQPGVTFAIAMLTLAALASLRCGGNRIAIAGDTPDGDSTYTLLYSTLGYESAATKRLLISQNNPDENVSEGLAFTWRLVDASGDEAASGHATYAGRGWGIPIWVADFSRVTAPGQYRMTVEAPQVKLASASFSIDSYLAFKTTFSMIALANADARVAPIELDNGYFDANSLTGGAASHAEFLVGLAEVYARRRTVLSDEQRTKLLTAMERAADYLLVIQDAGTGKFHAESGTRPFNNDEPGNTAQGIRGLARFAAQFQSESPVKAERAYRRAKLGEQWLLANAPLAYAPSTQAAVDYDLYKYANDESALLRATTAVRKEIDSYDLRTMDRSSSDLQPHFEAMYRMWRDLPGHDDRPLWIAEAKKVSAQYDDMIKRNIFAIVPSGTTDAERGTSASAQWDDVETAPPAGDGIGATFSNGWLLGRAADAAYLAEITKDPLLEQAATASLEWVGGLNPGVPREHVLGADPGASPRESASFLIGLNGREAQPWSSWSWAQHSRFATIVNGFRGGFVYDDSPQAGESSIGNDGAWLYATAVYEDSLNAGKRPPVADQALPPVAGLHVVSATPSESGGVLQLLVTVGDARGTPLAGVGVIGAWTGALLPDHAAHEGLLTNGCTTSAAGTCLLVLGVSELPVQRPITVTVTNLVHSKLRHDITADDPSQEATFR